MLLGQYRIASHETYGSVSEPFSTDFDLRPRKGKGVLNVASLIFFRMHQCLRAYVCIEDGTSNQRILSMESMQPEKTTARGMANQAMDHSSAPSMSAEQEMVFKLKMAIDERGRYSYRLNDMASGFAAGKGVSVSEARGSIESEFERQIGTSPKQYLDQRFNARKSNGQDQGMGR